MLADPSFSVTLSPLQLLLSIISGVLVGFSLGLIGGGGSILAIPLLLYFVGLASEAKTPSEYSYIVHLVLGTTALAVGLNAYLNAYMHFRKGNVRLKQGIFFTIPGVIGDIIGAYLSHLMSGAFVLFLFSFLMIAVAAKMWKTRCKSIQAKTDSKVIGNGKLGLASLTSGINLQRVIPAGLAVGFASGYFGIGGGFLVVPGLLFSSSLDMLRAVGTSLIAVGTFGVTAASTYAVYGDINVTVSILYLLGGIAGGYLGASMASTIPKSTLRKIFAIIIVLVAFYTMYQNVNGLYYIIHLL
ncbi:sulfite exporter TauE/SafE family protein [Sulfuracidifex metallicus]|uniref:sulfite exporter TauE/SafE family protein n=1 Tax=Sulfuracidifex metallicus TaxID=47303 RepID=UPI002273466B|nr:sulfite exporter TauE/SafE family protein [Sulfuracidifex metallicus]MCY0849521.1 sulfite exporter TauE/SafE family protein [Sulfuracidifex metallicus]